MRKPFKQGDYVVVSLDPQAGKEQKKRRPCIVVSVDAFNKASDFAIVCPITSTNWNSALHVETEQKPPVTGWIQCEQMKSLDMVQRQSFKVGKATQEVKEEVLAIIDSLLFHH